MAYMQQDFVWYEIHTLYTYHNQYIYIACTYIRSESLRVPLAGKKTNTKRKRKRKTKKGKMAEGRGSRVLIFINYCYCFVMVASICLLLKSPVLTCADKNFVLQTCNNTDEADLCARTLLSDPRSVNATDVPGLTEIALDIAARSADSASSHASDLADQYSGLPEQDVLDGCMQTWSQAADDLRDALTAVGERNYQGAVNLSNDAVDNGDNCEKSFADSGVKSVMSDVDKTTSEQCGLAADLIDLLNVPA